MPLHLRKGVDDVRAGNRVMSGLGFLVIYLVSVQSRVYYFYTSARADMSPVFKKRARHLNGKWASMALFLLIRLSMTLFF